MQQNETMNKSIKKNEEIDEIINRAQTQDIREVALLVEKMNPNGNLLFLKNDTFPDKVSLGDLNPKYYVFLSALKAQSDYETENIYAQQKENILSEIEWKNRLVLVHPIYSDIRNSL